jgi:hypothetical protein
VTVPDPEEGIRILSKELLMKTLADEIAELLGQAEERAGATG